MSLLSFFLPALLLLVLFMWDERSRLFLLQQNVVERLLTAELKVLELLCVCS